VLESYELSDEAIEERDTKEARIHHFKHWRDRVFPIERELGTLVFLEPDEDARHKAEETARSLARVVYRLDVKITQTWQIDPYIDDALTDLRNAVNELDGFWRDS
jgi:hypothetical protein